MITRCALFGLCVRDSKPFKDSAPKFNFAAEQCVFLESR